MRIKTECIHFTGLKKILSVFTAAAIGASLASCAGKDSSSSTEETSAEVTTGAVTTTTAPEESEIVTSAPEEEVPVQVTTSAEKEIEANVAKYVKFTQNIEAQEGLYSDNIAEKEDDTASGGKYLIGLNDGWSYDAEIPATQYYNIVLVVNSPKKQKSDISFWINGSEYSSFTTNGSGKFEAIGFDNIRLEKGVSTIGIFVDDSEVGLDYVIITASDTVAKMDLTYKKMPALSNKKATAKTRAVYNYLAQCYGKNMLSGQYDTVNTTAETDAIYALTGHYPAIRFGDLNQYTESDSYANDVENAIDWAENGGLVGYVWHWADPMGGGGYYTKGTADVPEEMTTDFDITQAVTEIDIAKIPIEDLEVMCSEGGITAQCLAIVKDIDTIAVQFSHLQENGVTVLFRPLNEAGGGWFWWGKDKDAYMWLWKLMYRRMTELHGLNNIIWVWNGQHPDWYVGDKYCDIISADIYDDGGASQLSAFLSLHRISENKMLALSECGNAPDVQMLANEKTLWCCFGIWGGSYVIDEYGNYSAEVIPAEEMTELYSNNIVICRDELPDFEELAKEIEKEDADKAQKEKEKEDKKKDKEKDKENTDSEKSEAE